MFVKFKIRGTNTEFLLMVNHLARVDSQLRQQQATGLRTWAAQQTLPSVPVGDYNFDYDIDDGEGNQPMDNMLSGNPWTSVYPDRVYQTRLSGNFHTVLDFILTANKPQTWTINSRMIVEGLSDTDNDRRSDHRPLEGRVLRPH